METIATESVRIKRIRAGRCIDTADQLAVEEPMQIQVAYESETGYVKKNMAVTMRSPGNDIELAIGFLFTEGIINYGEEVDSQHSRGDVNTVLITLPHQARPRLQHVARNFYTASSCGICGKASIDAIHSVSEFPQQKDNTRIQAAVFYGLAAKLRQQQSIFEQTGGLHASALFDHHGRFISLREDVGRHNALDKLIGRAFLDALLPLSHVILLLSGRASFELIQKAAIAGIRIIAAIGAPSSLAVELAKESNITLLGFLKEDGFNIYCGEERVDLQTGY